MMSLSGASAAERRLREAANGAAADPAGSRGSPHGKPGCVKAFPGLPEVFGGSAPPAAAGPQRRSEAHTAEKAMRASVS